MSNPYVDHVNGNNQTIDIYDAALRSTIGQSNGLATLDSNGKLPVSQLPSDSDKLDTAVLTGITESSTVATRAYAESDRFFLEPTGEYCMATSAISIGETLVENTNYTVITLEGVVASILTMGDQLNTIKADKVLSVTNGNLAGLNGSGNLTDSGWNGAKDTTSISGNPISISGLKSNQLAKNPIITLEPIQDLHGQSKPYPAGGGKNLIPMTVDSIKAANTAGTWSGNVYTYNGVTVTIITDNANNIIEFKVNGTCTGSSWAFTLTSAIPVSSGSYYINGNGSSATARLRYKNGSDWVYTNTIGSTDTPITLDSAYNLLVDIYIPNSTTFTNLLLHPMIRLSTVSDATFAPYSNISPISGYDKIEVLSCGKNLFDSDQILQASGWSKSNGVYSGPLTYIMQKFGSGFNVPKFKENTQYTISYYGWLADISTNRNFRFVFNYTDGASSQVAYNNYTTKTYITGTSASGKTVASIGCTYGSGEMMYLQDIQLEEGTSATTYVPYNKTTDLSESLGQTVYGATWYPRTGKLGNIYQYYEFDGSSDEGWSMPTSGVFIITLGTSAKLNTIPISNKFLGKNIGGWGDLGDNQCAFHPTTRTTFRVNCTSITTLTDWQSALASNPMQLVYEIDNPTTIQLTPHEISLLKDYAYVSTNGTNIALDYHNGEMASLSDVSQLGETVNELGDRVPIIKSITRATVVGQYASSVSFSEINRDVNTLLEVRIHDGSKWVELTNPNVEYAFWSSGLVITIPSASTSQQIMVRYI